MLYRGNNAGGQCFRNGLHSKDGKLYCTNHYKILGARMEKVVSRKRGREELTPQVQETAQPPEVEEQVEERGQVERPEKKVRLLEAKTEPASDDDGYDVEDALKQLKRKYKKKYRAKYAPPPKKPLVWEQFSYKNPRKVLNRVFKAGGGVGQLFTLPRE
jgi:hypothetical protein